MGNIARYLIRMLSKIGININRKLEQEEYDIISSLKMGDVILTRRNWQASNLFIKGKWKHAMLVRSTGSVVEAISSGVVITDIVKALKNKSEYIVLIPMFCKDEDMIVAANYAATKEGTPYDGLYNEDNGAYYCSELVYDAYHYAANFETEYGRIYEPQEIADDEYNWVKVAGFKA